MKASGRSQPAVQVERRDAERIPILGELRGEVMVYQPMTITELGTGGVQVQTAFPLHLDSIHELRLELGERSIIVKGRVTHCSITDIEHESVRYRTGLHFIEPPQRLRSAIGE